jgi:hypothetical protein
VAPERRGSIDPKLIHGIARLSTRMLQQSCDEGRLARLQDGLSRELGRLEGRAEGIRLVRGDSAKDGTIKLLGWATAGLSFSLGLADVLLSGSVGMSAGLSLGSGLAGLGVGVLMDRREVQRQRARNRELQELRKELRYLTIALARVRAARFLSRSSETRTGR